MFMYSSPSPLSSLQPARHPVRAVTGKNLKPGRTGLRIDALFFIAMLLLLCGWNAALAAQTGSKSNKAALSPADIYRLYCSVCHGDKGDGKSRAMNSFAVPPRDYTTPEAAMELTRERMITSVAYGRPGTAMTAWRTELTPAQIEAVVDYIRAKFMPLGGGGTAMRDAPSSKLLASRGGVLYMQACSMCHGNTGKRMTTGRMQPPPTDFTLPKAASELTRKRMIASITNGRPGTLMRGYGEEYSKSDIAAMADFIREAFMPAANPKK